MREALEKNYEVDIFRIEMVREYSNLLLHFNPRVILDTLLGRKPMIKAIKDISPYDLICVGTPNWYGRIAPPVNTFIEKMTNAVGKKALAFVSSGLTGENYADGLKKKLEEKGLKVLKKNCV